MVFREEKRYTAPNATVEAILDEHFYWDVREEPKPTQNEPSECQTEESFDDESPPKPKQKSPELAGLVTSLGDAWKALAEGSRRNHAGKLAASAKLVLKNEEFEDMIPSYAAAAICSDHKNGIDPKSYKAAAESPLAEKWDTAMKEELDAIGQHQVFGNFVELPEGRQALPSYWVYKIKRDEAGNVQRFKARLVCGGYYQSEGIDYQATYAPTAFLGHVSLVLVIAAKYDLETHQMDVCMAFLGVDCKDEIYMHPPEGYIRLLQNGSRYNDPKSKTSRKMILRFRKSLFGLKQSSNDWYSTFKDFVISIGFVASCVHGGLFVLENQGTVVPTVVLYADDLLIIARNGLIGQIKDQMKRRFRMHELGRVSLFIGMNITRNWEHHTIDIHEHSYIGTILAKFRMDVSRPVATPMAMKLDKRKPDEEACNPTIYQSRIGSLLSSMTVTWPNMAYAIAVISRYNHNPRNEHLVALKLVCRYQNGTKNWHLHFRGALRWALGGAYWGALTGALRERTLRGEGVGTPRY